MDDQIQAANGGETETPVTESAPVEQTTPDSEVDTSVEADTSQPTEEEKTVPLSALQRERELRKQEQEQNAIYREVTKKGRTAPPGTQGDGPFDEETAQNLERWYAQKRAEEENNRAAAFAAKHEEELKNPLLDAMVRKVIHDGNQIGRIVDQEDALVIAKGVLESQVQTAEAKAKTSGFDEGQTIALKKTQAGAVGETTVKTPPVDPTTMTAEEYRTYYGVQRVD